MLGRFWIWARKAFNRPITGKLCKCDAQRFGLELEQEYGYGFNNSCRFSIEPSDFGLSAIRCLWQRSLSATCSWFFVHIGTIIGINLFLQSSSRLTLPDVKLLSMNTHQTYPDLSCEGRCDPRNQSPWAQSGTESRAQSTRTSSTDSTLPIPIPLFSRSSWRDWNELCIFTLIYLIWVHWRSRSDTFHYIPIPKEKPAGAEPLQASLPTGGVLHLLQTEVPARRGTTWHDVDFCVALNVKPGCASERAAYDGKNAWNPPATWASLGLILYKLTKA